MRRGESPGTEASCSCVCSNCRQISPLALRDENIESGNSTHNNDCTYILNCHCCDAGLT